jgi:hypothetical protein
MRGDRTPLGGMMKIGTFFDPLDVRNHANFILHMMNILRASRGSKKRFSL